MSFIFHAPPSSYQVWAAHFLHVARSCSSGPLPNFQGRWTHLAPASAAGAFFVRTTLQRGMELSGDSPLSMFEFHGAYL